MQRVLRWLPAAFVAALLAVALAAPYRGALAERPSTEIDVLSYPVCSPIQIHTGDEAPWIMELFPGDGVVQPLGEVANFAACSLAALPSVYVNKRVDVVYWDPVALTPDPTMVALRSANYWATYSAINASRMNLYPPVITRTVPGVAEAPPAQTAMEYRVLAGGSGNVETVHLDADAPTHLPEGVGIRGTQYIPLGGPHPVFHHAVCGGDEILQSHHVLQSVMTTNATLDPVYVQTIQKFRLPVRASLRWVEFVLAPQAWTGGLDRGVIFVADAEGQSVPPMSFGTPLATAEFYTYPPTTYWNSHFDFPVFPVLEANHDYWLGVSTFGDYRLGARIRTASEDPYFQNGARELFQRGTAGSEAILVPNRTLNFRLIGVPATTVGVEAPRPAPATFRLSAAPNPTRGDATITWTGARNDLRFEVLDARGRRVSSGAAGVGATGQWTWSGRGDDGQALPAGIYFVRARDGAGRAAAARISLVR